MCSFTVTVITLSFICCESVLGLSIDQRQTGNMNVQVDLKNIKILALTKGKEEYVDYDYAYDYSEMTIKPQNGTTTTTIKPVNITETPLLIGNDNMNLTQFESTTEYIASNNTTEQAATLHSAITADVSSSTVATATIVAHGHDTTHNTTPNGLMTADNPTATNLTDCKKGFYRNVKGNCELKLQNPSNVLLKMLQQKTKGGNGVRKS